MLLTSSFWTKYFKVYDILNIFPPYQELLDTICERLRVKRGEKILDAGCGTGNLAMKIQERGGVVTGVDFCREALMICQRKNPHIKTVLTDLTKPLPFPDNYFDKVASNNVLYTIAKEKQIDVLRELNRVLKPGGVLVISNPKKGWSILKIYSSGFKHTLVEEGLFRTIKKMLLMLAPTLQMFYYNFKIKRGRHYYFFKPGEQRSLLFEAGFQKVSDDILLYGKQAILNIAIKWFK